MSNLMEWRGFSDTHSWRSFFNSSFISGFAALKQTLLWCIALVVLFLISRLKSLNFRVKFDVIKIDFSLINILLISFVLKLIFCATVFGFWWDDLNSYIWIPMQSVLQDRVNHRPIIAWITHPQFVSQHFV